MDGSIIAKRWCFIRSKLIRSKQKLQSSNIPKHLFQKFFLLLVFFFDRVFKKSSNHFSYSIFSCSTISSLVAFRCISISRLSCINVLKQRRNPVSYAIALSANSLISLFLCFFSSFFLLLTSSFLCLFLSLSLSFVVPFYLACALHKSHSFYTFLYTFSYSASCSHASAIQIDHLV